MKHNTEQDGKTTTSSGNSRNICGRLRYINQNPSYSAGSDGANDTRVNNVRDAMINAGVPAYKISVWAFGDTQLRQNNRVSVLFNRI